MTNIFDIVTEDVLEALLSYLGTRQLVLFSMLTKSHYEMCQQEQLWVTLYHRYGVSFPWILRPLSLRNHVLRLEKIRHKISKILPVLPVPNGKNTMDAKIVILGDRSAGLTSLAERFTQGVFVESISHDISDIRVRSTSLQISGINMKLKVFDKRVSSRRTPFSHVLYQGPVAILLAFDISNRNSFVNLSKHIWELERRILPTAARAKVGIPLGLIPRVLVGLKGDLRNQRQITFSEASDFARQNNMVYVETSAKTGESAELPFFLAANSIVQAQRWVQITHSHHMLRRRSSCKLEPLENNMVLSVGEFSLSVK